MGDKHVGTCTIPHESVGGGGGNYEQSAHEVCISIIVLTIVIGSIQCV